MQVNLFKNQSCNSKYSKVGRQIESRSFKLAHDLETVFDMVECSDSRRVNSYVEYLKRLARSSREYVRIGNAGSDNLFDLEMLGVGNYSMKYTVVFDFSMALDYVLHRIYGCRVQDVHRIAQYEQVSYSILNYDFRGMDTMPFGILFDISEELNAGFARLLENTAIKCCSADEQRNKLVYMFYSEVLGTLSNVKDYLVTYLNLKLKDRKFVYRSKSFSSVIVTSDKPLRDSIVLHQAGYDDFEVIPRNYELFEYAKEHVFTYDVNWNSPGFRR